MAHFVVIHKAYKNHFLIADPAKGLRKIEKSEILNDFDGFAIFCVPTDKFLAEKMESKSVFSRFVKLLLKQKKLFIIAIISSIILTLLGIASSFFNKILMDEILPYNLKNQLLIFCIGFGIIAIFNILLNSARQHLLLHLSIKIDIPLMLGYFKHIFALPMKFFGTRKTGDILTRFSDAGTIKDIFTTITLSLIIDIMLTVVSGVILFFMNKTLFAIIAVITIINTILVYIFKKPYKELNIQNMEKQSMLNSQIIDSLKGIETVKSFGVEENTMEKLENKYISALKVGYKTSVTSNIQGTLSGFLNNIGNIILMGLAALFVMNGDITLGSMMAFMSLSGYFMEPIGRLVGLQMQIQEANIAMKRMAELYDIEEEQSNKENLRTDIDLKGNISISNLTFRYGKHAPVLKNININIGDKEKIAIVGASGGGKSTLAKLLLGLWTPEEGHIIINGNDIEDIDKNFLRQSIAYVPQNVELFSGTIEENIRLGNPIATYDDIKEACCKAGCQNFIEKLPAKYGTYLEDAGNNLSGGERQRLALARALIKKPKILILDEATSNLDFISEANIFETLFSMDCTLIIIAHRISTIKNCDNIFVIDGNEIVENGTHKTLLNKKGVYHKIWNSQVGKKNSKEKSKTEDLIINTVAIADDDEITYC